MLCYLNSRSALLTVAAAVVISSTAARAEQGNMDRALALLQDARHSLQEATPNKGGHKATAVQLIDQAIAEVREGIRFANQHGGGGR